MITLVVSSVQLSALGSYFEDYERLSNKLFGREGYADLNKNGVIEDNESLDALRRMGYENPNLHKSGILLRFSTNELEMAIKSYEAELQEKTQ